MNKLTWTTIKYPIGKLIEWEKNPVMISERAAKRLAAQLKKGQDLPYVAAAPLNGKDGLPLLDGHQRRTAELTINQVDPKTLVPVLVPNRKLSEKEKEEWVIGHRKNTGAFDPDALLNWFEADDLMDWGFDQKELEKIGFEFGESVDVENNVIPEQFAILITCENEQTQAQLLERFIEDGLQCRALVS